MLQKISLVFNIILTIAVSVLFYLHFSSDGNENVSITPLLNISKDGKYNEVVYVNFDTLLKKYEFVEEARKKLENAQTSKERELQAKSSLLEGKVAEFREKANALSEQEMQRQQQALMMEEQELMRFRDKLTQDLAKEEQDLNEEMTKKIAAYLKKYKTKMPFKYVLSYSQGGALLYANDSLDVTKQVIEGLNLELKMEKENAKK